MLGIDYEDAGLKNKLAQLKKKSGSASKYNKVVVSNSDAKAKKHQLGIGVPKRPFLGYNASDAKNMKDIIEDELKRPNGNLDNALRSIGEYMMLTIDQNFQTETDPDGRKWKPNSAFTIAEKKRQSRIMKVLQSTGLMRSRTKYKLE